MKILCVVITLIVATPPPAFAGPSKKSSSKASSRKVTRESKTDPKVPPKPLKKPEIAPPGAASKEPETKKYEKPAPASQDKTGEN